MGLNYGFVCNDELVTKGFARSNLPCVMGQAMVVKAGTALQSLWLQILL